MRITKVETLQLAGGITVHAGPIKWLWVRIHTDTGLIGLGETYPNPAAEGAIVLETLAPILLNRDPSEIDKLWADMFLAALIAKIRLRLKKQRRCHGALDEFRKRSMSPPQFHIVGEHVWQAGSVRHQIANFH